MTITPDTTTDPIVPTLEGYAQSDTITPEGAKLVQDALNLLNPDNQPKEPIMPEAAHTITIHTNQTKETNVFEYPELLTKAEAARIFAVSPKTVGTWASEGKIRTLRTPGGGVRVYASEVKALIPEGWADMLTSVEVGAIFRVSPKTVARWANEDKILSFTSLGQQRRYSPEQVKALMTVVEEG